ncbi:MAG: DUF6263 family protein [Armatimonadota bacterium]
MRRVGFATLLAVGLVTAASAQVKLELKFPEGEKRTVVETTRVAQTLTIAGMNVETRAEGASTTEVAYGARRPDGNQPITETIKHVKLRLEVPGSEVDFDSDKPAPAVGGPLDQVIESLKASKGVSYTILLSPQNKVAGVEGLDKVVQNLPPAVAESLKSEYSPEKVKQAAEQAYSVLPAEPVKKGDRWSRTEVMNLGAGQQFVLEAFYEYEGPVEKGGKTLDRIAYSVGSVKYQLEPNSPLPLQVANSDLKIDSSGGAILIDRERGAVVERTSKMRVIGPMTFDVMGMQIPGKLDVTIESTRVPK